MPRSRRSRSRAVRSVTMLTDEARNTRAPRIAMFASSGQRVSHLHLGSPWPSPNGIVIDQTPAAVTFHHNNNHTAGVPETSSSSIIESCRHWDGALFWLVRYCRRGYGDPWSALTVWYGDQLLVVNIAVVAWPALEICRLAACRNRLFENLARVLCSIRA